MQTSATYFSGSNEVGGHYIRTGSLRETVSVSGKRGAEAWRQLAGNPALGRLARTGAALAAGNRGIIPAADCLDRRVVWRDSARVSWTFAYGHRFAARPDDVATLQRMVRSLAAERTPSPQHRPRSNGFISSSRSYIARVEATPPPAPAKATKTKSQIERSSMPATIIVATTEVTKQWYIGVLFRDDRGRRWRP
jgi:hypothetical protein